MGREERREGGRKKEETNKEKYPNTEQYNRKYNIRKGGEGGEKQSEMNMIERRRKKEHYHEEIFEDIAKCYGNTHGRERDREKEGGRGRRRGVGG